MGEYKNEDEVWRTTVAVKVPFIFFVGRNCGSANEVRNKKNARKITIDLVQGKLHFF